MVRRRLGTALLVLTLLVSAHPHPAAAQDGALYARPVLTVDPGRHTAMIRRAAVDAAGRFAVTGSEDKTVRVWALADGTLQRTIRLPAGPGNVGKAFAVAISPDGALVAAGGFTAGDGQPKNLFLFDRAGGGLVTRIGGLPSSIFHLVFSPDGRYLVATLGGPNGWRVYDRRAGWAEVARDGAGGGHSYGAAFRRDGWLAVTSYDGRVRLYDAAFTPRAERDLGKERRPAGIAFSPDGRQLAVGFANSTEVSLLDGRSLAPRRGPDTAGIGTGSLVSVAWSQDGQTLWAGGRYQRSDGTFPAVSWEKGGLGLRREWPAGGNTLMTLAPLADGGVLVAGADPSLARLGTGGRPRWEQRPPKADFRGQSRSLAVSSDGRVVDFGYELWGKAPARFDLRNLMLSVPPPADGATRPPVQTGLPLADWENQYTPTLAGTRLPLENLERSRSVAVEPGAAGFVLGTEWSLRAFDAKGDQRWRQDVPEAVWAVTISGDGRLVVVAYDDGTIRWHRSEDGRELLAVMPLEDRRNWVAWTPEGFYDASPGARGVLRWHVNRGWDQAADSVPVETIPELYRPDLIPGALTEGGIAAMVPAREMAEVDAAIKRRLAPSDGPRLHVLTVGINDYGDKAKGVAGLRYAKDDARDVEKALDGYRGKLFGQVMPQMLIDTNATRDGIIKALYSMRDTMTGGKDQNMAVMLFSGHGDVLDGEFYFLPHGVDTQYPAALASSGLSADELKKHLKKLAERGRVLVLIDACYSGALSTAMAADSKGLADALGQDNILIVTSSGADQKSFEKPEWGHGALTYALLEILNNPDRSATISAGDLVGHLKAQVPALTKGAQKVSSNGAMPGTLFPARLAGSVAGR